MRGMEDATGKQLLSKDTKSLEATTKSSEAKHPERPLSPVLSNSNIYRKMIRSKSRVRLAKRFAEHQNHAGHNKVGDERLVNKLFNDLQVFDCNNADKRLKKIQEFECEKKKFSECLYIQKPLKSSFESHAIGSSNDFNFKKPLSPLSGTKKAKPHVGVVSHDCNDAHDTVTVSETVYKTESLQITKSTHAGFCTGAGKSIIVLPESLKKHSEIFSDILSTNDVSVNISRKLSNFKNEIPPESKKMKFCVVDSQLAADAKDVFVHPNISDTQMILAADIAMSVMDIPSDDWVAPVPNTPSDLENKISEMNSIEVQEKVVNDEECPSQENDAHSTTLEYEINELEKVLNGDFRTGSQDEPICLGNEKTKSNCASNVSCGDSVEVKTDSGLPAKSIMNINISKQIRSDCMEGKLSSSTCTESSAEPVTSKNQDEDYFRGFESYECNLIQNCSCKKVIEIAEEVFEASSGSIVVTRAQYQEAFAIIRKKMIENAEKVLEASSGSFVTKAQYEEIFDTIRTSFNDLQRVMNTKDQCKSNKHVASELVESDKKRFKVDHVDHVDQKNQKRIDEPNTFLKRVKHSFTQICKAEENPSEHIQISKVAKERLQFDGTSTNTHSVGFSTAGGKRIAISEKAMRKAKKLLLDDQDVASTNFETPEKNEQTNIHTMEFSTAGGRSIKISENDDLASNKFEVAENIQTVGFSTAGGRGIQISEEAVRKARTKFTDEDLASNKFEIQKPLGFDVPREIETNTRTQTMQPIGFSTAGGKSINISEKAMRKAKTIFTEEELTANELDVQKPPRFNAPRRIEKVQANTGAENIQPIGFSTAGGRSTRMSEEVIRRAKTKLTGEYLALSNSESSKSRKFDAPLRIEDRVHSGLASTNNQQAGFSTAGGKTIKISNTAMSKAKSLFTDENLLLLPTNEDDYLKHSSSGSSLNSVSNAYVEQVPNRILKQNDVNFLKDAQKQNLTKKNLLGGFSTGNGRNIQLSESTLQKAKSIFGDEDLSSCLGSTATSGGAPENVNQKALNKENLLKTIETDKQGKNGTAITLNPRKLFPDLKPSLDARDTKQRSPARFGSAKKRLGVSFCKQIAISNDRLKKAELLFQDFDEADQNISNAGISTPVKHTEATIYSSTPQPAVQRTASERIGAVQADSLTNLNITPVKQPPFIENMGCINLKNDQNSPIVFQNQTEGDAKRLLDDINKEYERMEHRLKVILERKKALEMQKKLTESDDGAYRRQTLGVLLGKKQVVEKVSLKQLAGDRKPGDAVTVSASRQLLEVTAQNAEYLHFNCNWQKDFNEQCSVVHTADGAVLIPNIQDVIGLSEIMASFKAMPGVDPKLLPKGWIRNHFKWIVWKLASLERSFPDVFAESLSLENIIQQLKYRYDREIDRAERSALRRITEKDDVPQKRMILCVADIIKVSDRFELVLTDGWYSIRTVIDQLLCRQVSASKIVIGTKLIMQCAEIINCEGCHPLEITDGVRLKINYNCTRRAVWHAKLGYQRAAEPFPISLGTVQPDGGLIGCIKVLIARVYPLKYMERQNGKTVWRNNKAEEKRAQEWENQRTKELEVINHKIRTEYEKDLAGAQRNNMVEKVDPVKISEITSPNLLYQLLENANDPESFGSKLSSSQFASAMEYKRNMYAKQQQELSSRISDEVKKLQCLQRDVCPVLKLQVVDANEENDRGFIFNVWKPTEEHLQTLKEGCAFSVFNVSPRLNGDLAATTRTHFKLEPLASKKVQRYLLPISALQQMATKPLFNEYDTVGTAVRIRKNAHYQEMWLTDFASNLLLIKIVEGSEQCSLVDNIDRGQTVAAVNLVFWEYQDGFAQAIANQTTVITSFPQHKFLQAGLETYSEQLPKNLMTLLNDCDKKIEACSSKVQAWKSSVGSSCISSLMDSATVSTSYGDAFDDSSEDNTLIPSRLTTTDVAMSLIDTDRYFETV